MFLGVALVMSVARGTSRTDASGTAEQNATPAFVYDNADGCMDIFAYAWNAGRSEVFWIDVDLWSGKLAMPNDAATFDLVRAPEGVRAGVDLWTRDTRYFDWYCTDVRMRPGPTTWRAVGGTITVTSDKSRVVVPPGIIQANYYAVTVRLTDGVFEAPSGGRVSVGRTIEFRARAGRSVGG
jgi:hypothetical protein